MGLIFRVANRILKSFALRKKHIYLHATVASENTLFGGYNAIGSGANCANSNIGTGSYIGSNCLLPSSLIGKYCSIGSSVRIAVGNHPTNVFVSTHPAFFSIRKQAGISFVKKNKFKEMQYAGDNSLVIIGNDVWIGTNVTILGGVQIGNGSIIGAGSVVTKDILPYTINVGVPARSIKKRFSDSQIEWLQEFKWWDKPQDWIERNAEYFDDIDRLIESISRCQNNN